MNRSKARETALFYLFSYQFNASLRDKGLEVYEQGEGIRPDEENVSFFEALVTKTLTHAPYYDQLISLALQDWSLARLGQVELCLVRLAMAEYELVAFDEKFIPILISEITKLSNTYCEEKSASFLHGLLASTFHLLTSTCPVAFVEAKESFPDYPTLQSRYESQFSKEVPELEKPLDSESDQKQNCDRGDRYSRDQSRDYEGRFNRERSFDRDRMYERPRSFDGDRAYDRPRSYDRDRAYDRPRPYDRDKAFDQLDQVDELEAQEVVKPSRPDPAQQARQRSILASSRMVKVVKRRPTLASSNSAPSAPGLPNSGSSAPASQDPSPSTLPKEDQK